MIKATPRAKGCGLFSWGLRSILDLNPSSLFVAVQDRFANRDLLMTVGEVAPIRLGGHVAAGEHGYAFPTRGLANGVYLARLVTGTGIATTKLTILR